MTEQLRKTLSAKQAVLKVVRRLRNNGYEALLAGGCVRDMLLGKIPNDYDIATNATPDTITNLFRRTLSVGARFGVVVVLLGGRQIEVATFRSEDSYTDGRRPGKVVFTDARHDALRRDFTINGMFLDPLTDEVIDYVNGREDLKKGVIRAIGCADERFAEDHLRMLRAIRFACRFDFRIARATEKAIGKHAASLARISAERITGEIERILVDPFRARGMELARKTGLLKVICKSIPSGQLDFGIKVLAQLPARSSFALALAGLLVELDEKSANRFCRQMKISNELRKQTVWLITRRALLLEAIPLSRGRLKQWLARPLFEPLTLLIRCYLKATGQTEAPLRRLRRQIKELGAEPVAPERLLNGHDLLKLGVAAGPMLGQLMEELYLGQLENQVKNKTQARAWVVRWLGQHQNNNKF